MLNKSKIGSMAVVSIDFDEFFKNDTNIKTIPKVNKKFNKKIVHELFLIYAELTTDIFWTKKFYLWASGKLPRFFTMNGNTITFNKNNIKATWQPTTNNQEDTLSCIQFFTVYAGLFSKKDELEAIQIESIEDESDDVMKSWTQLNKYEQEILIRIFVNELSNGDMKLSPKERRLLLQSIRLGIATKNITNQSIDVENNKIINIKGMLWNPETREFRVHYNKK